MVGKNQVGEGIIRGPKENGEMRGRARKKRRYNAW